ncbi:reverse transcriptase [Sclerotinia borealis F-4128]|uniref:Reverse transcriptase n=1 Tax=Sclerotinia borealis (strain F-4128) TaxID=1432307 RepID=W9BXZ5_SCLBF|nr:reverse transcriptase [Sclerotinia borealis F-4128]
MASHTVPPEVVDLENADFTKTRDPETPSNLQNRSKRRQCTFTNEVPLVLKLGNKANNNNTSPAMEAFKAKLAEHEHAERIQRKVMTGLVETIDRYINFFAAGDERTAARKLSTRVVEILTLSINDGSDRASTALYTLPATRSAASLKTQTTTKTYVEILKTPKTSQNGAGREDPPTPQEAPPKAPHDNTRAKQRAIRTARSTDHRLLIAISPAARISRPAPYTLRSALIGAITGLTLADVPTISATKTGHASAPIGNLVQLRSPWGPSIDLHDSRTPSRYSESHGSGGSSTDRLNPKPVRGFRFFNASELAREIKAKPTITRHDTGCQGWCNPARYTRLTHCANCGARKDAHKSPQGSNCTAKTRCTNCFGPFAAGHQNCPAVPKIVDSKATVSTKPQLKAIRKPALALEAAILANQKPKDNPKKGLNEEALAGSQQDTEMGEDPQPNAHKIRDLTVCWANMGRIPEIYDIILQMAFEDKTDVLCVQEPSTFPLTKTKTHPGWTLYAPIDSWTGTSPEQREAERPRVLTGSDHHTLVTTIPGRGIKPLDQHNICVPETELLRLVGLVANGVVYLPTNDTLNTPERIDDFAEQLTQIIKQAMTAVGTTDKGKGKAAPWWIAECKRAYTEHLSRQAAPGSPPTTATKDFKTTVRAAKRDYWRHIIDDISSDKDLYKIVSWHKLAPNLKSPPITSNGVVIEDSMEKAEAFRTEILDRFRNGHLPWNSWLTLEEVEASIIGVSSMSPGTDQVTVRILKACWDYLKDPLRWLYQKCLEHSYFPKTWKLAEVAMLPKIGKKDMTSARLWRPITLLSCIGKGLERIVAKRLGWTALRYGIISPQHGEALPKRSAMDLVVSFIYDVEVVLGTGKKVTIVIMDM